MKRRFATERAPASETRVTRLPDGQATGTKRAPKETITLQQAVDIRAISGARVSLAAAN